VVNNSAQNKNLLWLLVLAALLTSMLFLLCVLVIPIRFETNDDVCMELLASGFGFLNKPDPHILFIHIWIGQILSALYQWKNNVPWYPIYLEIANFVAITVLGFCAAQRHRMLQALIITTLFFVASAIHAVVVLQFTFTAFLVALAGAALLLTACDTSTASKYQRVSCGISGIALLVLSSLIRYASFQLTCVLMIMLLCIREFKLSEWRLRLLLPMIFVGLVLLLGNRLFALNAEIYGKDEGWSNFYAINSATAEFTNYGRVNYVEKRPDLLKTAGWSVNDVRMLSFWGYVDPKLYTTAKIKNICQQLPPVTRSANEIFQQLLSVVEDPALYPTYVILLLTTFFSNRGGLSGPRFPILVLGCSGLIAALTILLKINPRTYLPVFSFLLYFSLYYSRDVRFEHWQAKKRKLGQVLAIVGLLGYGLWVHHQYLLPAQQWLADSKRLSKAIKDYSKSSQNLFVTWGDSFPYENIEPFCNLKDYFATFRLLPVGGQSQTPTFQSILARNQIPDFFLGLLKPGVFLISSDVENSIVKQYMLEHYRRNVEFSKIFDGFDGQRMVIYKCFEPAKPLSEKGPS
jgi:hypothetical protein